MLALGFGCGLPYLLIGNTFSFWLTEMPVSLGLIGAFSWATLPYSLKFIWAKYMDCKPAPFIGGGYGLRRSWILLSQIGVILSLMGLIVASYYRNIPLMAAFCLLAAFAGASQDTSVDAFRIESGILWNNSGTVLSTYQFGYRIALLLSDGIVFMLAARLGWPKSYLILAILMTIPVVAVHLSKEEPFAPRGGQDVIDRNTAADRDTFSEARGMPTAIGARILFFGFIATYRLPDIIINPVINPLFHDVGINKDFLAGLHIAFGLTSSFIGILVGGASVITVGTSRTLYIGAGLQIVALLAFSALAFSGGNLSAAVFSSVAENFTSSFTGIALVSYMSAFIKPGFAGAQFATLTSIYSLFGKLLGGLSGFFISYIGQTARHLEAYAIFFLLVSLTGIPAVVLLSIKRRASAHEGDPNQSVTPGR